MIGIRNDVLFGFKEGDENIAIEKLTNEIGEDHWFLQIINYIKSEASRIRITDCFIQELTPVRVGIIKLMWEIPTFIIDSSRITQESIVSFVEKFSKIKRDKIFFSSTLDFSFGVFGYGFYRINYSSDYRGAKLNIRVLNSIIPTLEETMFPSHYIRFLQEKVASKSIKFNERQSIDLGKLESGGLIVHSGPTGSGKTTSMASGLHYYGNHVNGIVCCYENPIEYWYVSPGYRSIINQYEIGVDIKPSMDGQESVFDVIKKHLLRNSPQIAMISEMRTSYEITETLDIASRGHLLFTTMHARNVVETLSVLINALRTERFLIATSLQAIVSQLLILNKNNRIVPLYEILIPNDQRFKTMIASDKYSIEEIKALLYIKNELDYKTFYSFLKCIDDRVNMKILDKSEGEIMKNNIRQSLLISDDM